ncbi:hypothetical protein INR49_027187 [Caranx melampygus]|nr:hypothetical protein INR49_027187 [Caranx melampygus]
MVLQNQTKQNRHSDDGFGTSLKDQLPLDEGRHIVRLGGGVSLACFHGYLCDIAVIVTADQGILRVAAVLSEDGKLFLQLDLLPIENVMSYNQHWHPLVEGGRRAATAQGRGSAEKNMTVLITYRSPITFPARPELCLDTISPCSSTSSHSGGLLPSTLPLKGCANVMTYFRDVPE